MACCRESSRERFATIPHHPVVGNDLINMQWFAAYGLVRHTYYDSVFGREKTHRLDRAAHEEGGSSTVGNAG